MENIKRWNFFCWKDECLGQHTTEPDGEWVKFSDHVVALRSTIDNTIKSEIAKCANDLCSFSHGVYPRNDVELVKRVEQRLRQLSDVD